MRIWLVMFVAGMLGASVQVSFAERKAYIGEGVLLLRGMDTGTSTRCRIAARAAREKLGSRLCFRC